MPRPSGIRDGIRPDRPDFPRGRAASTVVAAFFEETVALNARATDVANWLTGEFRQDIREMLEEKRRKVTADGLAELLGMLDSGRMTRVHAKEMFREMVATGWNPAQFARSERTGVLTDESSIAALVERVLRESDVAKKAGEDKKAFNYLVGQVLKLEPRADAKVVAKISRARLSSEDDGRKSSPRAVGPRSIPKRRACPNLSTTASLCRPGRTCSESSRSSQIGRPVRLLPAWSLQTRSLSASSRSVLRASSRPPRA